MLIESPLLPWLIFGALFIGLPVLLIVAWGIARLLPLTWPIVPFALFLSFVLLCGFTLGKLLDSLGGEVIGELLQKKEVLLYYPDGSWGREMTATVKYRMSELTPYETDILSVRQNRFDELHNGDFIKLRTSDHPNLLRLTRLEDQHTFPEFWARAASRPFFLILTVGAVLLIAARLVFPLSAPMVFFLAGLCGIGAWWLSDVGLPLWEQVAVRISPLETVRANVKEIHPSYFGTGARASILGKLYSPYQLILLETTPLGQSESLLAIDAIDPGTPPTPVKTRETIAVQYSPGNPRLALVADATRNHIWRNSMVTTLFAVLALLVIIKVAFLLRSNGDDEEPGVESA